MQSVHSPGIVHSQLDDELVDVNEGGTSVVEQSQAVVETVLSGSFNVPQMGQIKYDPFNFTAEQATPYPEGVDAALLRLPRPPFPPFELYPPRELF